MEQFMRIMVLLKIHNNQLTLVKIVILNNTLKIIRRYINNIIIFLIMAQLLMATPEHQQQHLVLISAFYLNIYLENNKLIHL